MAAEPEGERDAGLAVERADPDTVEVVEVAPAVLQGGREEPGLGPPDIHVEPAAAHARQHTEREIRLFRDVEHADLGAAHLARDVHHTELEPAHIGGDLDDSELKTADLTADVDDADLATRGAPEREVDGAELGAGEIIRQVEA